jgi:hypothetical protein
MPDSQHTCLDKTGPAFLSLADLNSGEPIPKRVSRIELWSEHEAAVGIDAGVAWRVAIRNVPDRPWQSV